MSSSRNRSAIRLAWFRLRDTSSRIPLVCTKVINCWNFSSLYSWFCTFLGRAQKRLSRVLMHQLIPTARANCLIVNERASITAMLSIVRFAIIVSHFSYTVVTRDISSHTLYLSDFGMGHLWTLSQPVTKTSVSSALKTFLLVRVTHYYLLLCVFELGL